MTHLTITRPIVAGADDGNITSTGGFSDDTNGVIAGDVAGLFQTSAWLRFTEIDIPQGASIVSAIITMIANTSQSVTTCQLTINGNLANDAAAPTNVSEYNSATRTSNSTAWQPAATTANSAFVTPDITDIIQEIINQSGWARGNALQIFIEDNGSDSSANRDWISFENSPSQVAYITISYEVENTILSPLEFFLIPQPKETVFTGVVDSTPSVPYISVDYNTGVTGSFGAPLPGQTVEFTGRGDRRLKSWSGGASGTIEIDESDDVGPLIQAGDSIKIYNQFRLWPKYPRFIQSGSSVTIYADYDEAYTNQTNQWRPVAVAGPIAVAFLSGGTVTVSFVGDRSYALAVGSSISSYLWTAYDSAEGTSTSQGTEASPVTFTWTTAGWHLVSLKVTDNNGNTHTNYTYAIIIDPASPEDVAFIDFDATNDNFDFEQGGGSCNFTVRGDGSEITFPTESLIVHACRGTQTTATGGWPFRQDTLFVGWVMGDSVRQNPDTGNVSFRTMTVDAVMKNLSMFPVSLTDVTTPVDWTQAKSLTVDRAFSFLAKYWSTLDLMTSIISTNDTRFIKRQDFGPTNLYAMAQNELLGSILAKCVVSPQGVLYNEIDYNVQNSTERATVTTGKTLHKGVWANDVFVEERADYEQPARVVKMSGIIYSGSQNEEICPSFAEAPGDAPKSYGGEINVDRLILSSQADLNVRCGHMLAKMNLQYPTYRMIFFNDGAFSTVPQKLFPAVIESGDNDRSLAQSVNLIPRRISRRFDHQNGYYEINVEFEPESSGIAGVTVDIPCGPPAQKLPDLPPPPGAIPGLTALIAGTTGTSFYFEPGLTQTWQRRVNGLLDPSQLGFEDMIPDPWSTFKQGYNPERVIVWGSGKGFLVRSIDSGQNWSDRSGYLTAPNWDGETGTITNVTFLRLNADIFSEDKLYLLARWQISGNWRGAIGQSSDGFNFTWHNLTGTNQSRPLGMSLDRGNGQSLWVTTWEGTSGIYLSKFDTSDMSLSASYLMTIATSAEVDAQTYYATPFNRLGQADEVFIYGRMNEPQGLTGTVQVMVNTGGGATGSYAVIERNWGADICGAFGADEAGNYYAVRQG